ncbi:MAG: hypothetical protein WCJ33_01700 [Pseudomonadota bacterium]
MTKDSFEIAEEKFQLSLQKLVQGEHEEGWRLYEYRWQRKNAEIRKFNKPVLLGKEDIRGITILLHFEMGLGDTIQFCRYAKIVADMGANVILEVQKPLMRILKNFDKRIRLIGAGEELPEFDYHTPLMSLPLACKTTLKTIPADIPYLFANVENQKIWRERLGAKTKPRIGLVWSGNPTHENDHNRSMNIKFFAPLLALDFEFHSLQKEIRADDEEFRKATKIISHTDYLHDFLDTASLVNEMDLVISVDTSIAHLTGAMGKKLWLIIPFIPDFRWFLAREDSPYYPTARIFRQEKPMDWEGIIKRISNQLDTYPQ